jgi:[ribosomal protein S5]-alanine N-acetyltransferase
MYGPIIQGSQFRLRPPRLEDAAPFVDWFADQEVTALLNYRMGMSLEFEQAWLRRAEESPDTILWVIEHEGRVVGNTVIAQIDWANQHGTTGLLIGDKTVWGRGIARELMRMRADYAFTQHPFGKLKSGYLEGNEASRRAQLAAGYREVGRLHREHFRAGRWIDEVHTELLREDWERRRQELPNL